MFERALAGDRRYWGLVIVLLFIIATGFITYLWQLKMGLQITGMSRDVSWGFYIAQFTYLVGIAASAVMLVLPYYLHDYKAFGRITILGEFLAVAAVSMCVMFILVDLGKPMRVFNVLLHPTPNSILFWDMMVLSGYFLLNIVIGWTVLEAEKNSAPPPSWIKPLIYLSIPWAPCIHIVTAFLYAGLPGRGFWLTAIMAPRFLVSAFASGPALLILLAMILKKFTKFDPGTKPIQTLAKIVTYCIIINVLFVLFEAFTVFYSQIPEHMRHFEYLFVGIAGFGKLVPWMWVSMIGMITASILLVIPAVRRNHSTLALACVMVVVTTWIDKGLGLITGGFVPNPFDRITEYWPTAPELLISIGVWAAGFLILTILYKIAVSIKEELG
ncbi:MAG TPA: polysulfide reductase NrfD [Syntrophales bacterium]|nr:polysulfide reductase NrfD [Syntrophales bacterium]HPQ44904.1 polysulfide reductase NrfD [Syntrophales bacterium]